MFIIAAICFTAALDDQVNTHSIVGGTVPRPSQNCCHGDGFQRVCSPSSTKFIHPARVTFACYFVLVEESCTTHDSAMEHPGQSWAYRRRDPLEKLQFLVVPGRNLVVDRHRSIFVRCGLLRSRPPQIVLSNNAKIEG